MSKTKDEHDLLFKICETILHDDEQIYNGILQDFKGSDRWGASHTEMYISVSFKDWVEDMNKVKEQLDEFRRPLLQPRSKSLNDVKRPST